MKTAAKIGMALAVACYVVLPVMGSPNRRTPVVAAVEKALPAVVNIGTEKLVKVRYSDPARRFRGDLFDEFFREFFGDAASPGYRVAHSLGSGMIIDPRGYILSNYHVIERASKIRVTLSDDTTYDATFIAGDERSDLALLKIEADKPLASVNFAEGDDLMLGETVIVLGSPFGLAQTVTVGVLSSKNREARYGGQVLYRDILQTDAAVNPGSSGGPLLNIDGEVIGINVAIYRQAQNIGFAVPVTRAEPLLARWMSPKHLTKTWPGFEAEETNGVVRVAEVDPAVKADVRVGDIIHCVGDREVKDLLGFHRELLSYVTGDRFTLALEREGKSRTVEVEMIAVPEPSGKLLAEKLLGLKFGDRDDLGKRIRTSLNEGLPITEVVKGSVAANAGLKAGLLVTRINETDIGSLDDVGLALEHVRPGDVLALSLLSIDDSGASLLAQSFVVQLTVE